MNKKLIILIVVVVLLVGGYFFLGTIIGGAVTTAVNSFAPDVTGTKVTLGGAMISPFNGSGTLKELYVGNPEGFSDGKAFSCAKIHVNAEITSVFGDTLVIDEIVIEGPEFVYETKLTSSNIGKILDNVNKFTGPSAPEEKSSGPAKKIIIKHFVLEKAMVAVSAGGVTLPVPVPRLELNDIGVKNGGDTPAQATAEVLQQVLGSVSKSAIAALAKGGGALGKGAEDAAKKITGGLKGLLDKAAPSKP